MSKIQS